MHRTAVWQHSSNLNIKIVLKSIEHFLWNPSDFFSDDVLFCVWIVFTNSVFRVPPQKIRRVEIMGIGWLVVCLRNEVVPHFSNRTEHLNTSGITSHGTD